MLWQVLWLARVIFEPTPVGHRHTAVAGVADVAVRDAEVVAGDDGEGLGVVVHSSDGSHLVPRRALGGRKQRRNGESASWVQAIEGRSWTNLSISATPGD